MIDNKKNESRRYIGKIKEMEGKYGPFKNILIDNPDMSSEYSKGSLIWIDKESGKKFLVKQVAVRGSAEHDLAKGFVNSLAIDLDNEYQVQELD